MPSLLSYLLHRGHQGLPWSIFGHSNNKYTTDRNDTSRQKVAQGARHVIKLILCVDRDALSFNCDLHSKTLPQSFSEDRELRRMCRLKGLQLARLGPSTTFAIPVVIGEIEYAALGAPRWVRKMGLSLVQDVPGPCAAGLSSWGAPQDHLADIHATSATRS